MAERLIIFISIAIGTTGIKLKKKVTDGTTITTTEYMQGFQYTNNALDFFPHTSTALSAGSGGYVKALAAGLGGETSYDFKYVFTYTDHTSAALSTGLGNIRLKYAQDPSNNNKISILEEDHYYPYGLKHRGYNSFQQIFATEEGDGQGTGIVLTPVNPFLGDSHKYKPACRTGRFGGKEYQDEFDVNTYDFGARNYDPALVRTFTQDPLGEVFYELSPYSFLNNNPLSNIDPTGALTLTGQAARDWFQGLKDDIVSRPRENEEREDIIFENNKGKEVARILTSEKEHSYVNVDTDLSLSNPIIVDGRGKDAAGVEFEWSTTFGGGAHGGTGYIYFLTGTDKNKLFNYNYKGGNIGAGTSIGISGYTSEFNQELENITHGVANFMGSYNGYSIGTPLGGASLSWANLLNTSDQFAPGRGATQNNPWTWKSISVGDSKSFSRYEVKYFGGESYDFKQILSKK